MRRYIIDCQGDNDSKHKEVLEELVAAINRGDDGGNVMRAVLVADEPLGTIKPILNCVARIV